MDHAEIRIASYSGGMKAKRVICVVKGHDWIVGRIADDNARRFVTGKKSYHNRACTRCCKEEWNADDVEEEAERLMDLRDRLGVTRTHADIDPRDAACDPDEFP
jgi:hypothetical protein